MELLKNELIHPPVLALSNSIELRPTDTDVCSVHAGCLPQQNSRTKQLSILDTVPAF